MSKQTKQKQKRTPRVIPAIQSDLFPADIAPALLQQKIEGYAASLADWEEIQILDHVRLQRLPVKSDKDQPCLGLKILPTDAEGQPLPKYAVYLVNNNGWFDQILESANAPIFKAILDALIIRNARILEDNKTRRAAKKTKQLVNLDGNIP